jgi:hypothetical protein
LEAVFEAMIFPSILLGNRPRNPHWLFRGEQEPSTSSTIRRDQLTLLLSLFRLVLCPVEGASLALLIHSAKGALHVGFKAGTCSAVCKASTIGCQVRLFT